MNRTARPFVAKEARAACQSAPRATSSRLRGALLGVLLVGCAPEDAVVGTARAVDGGSKGLARLDAASDGPATSRVIFTQFASDEGLWDRQRLVDGATITFGAADSAAADGEEVVLRLPGHPGLGPTDDSGPDLATQISTKQFLRFGKLRTRVRFAACAPSEEAVSAAFAYFNDGSDANGNGLADNPELDFQVFCGTPTFVVMTAWTDFDHASDGSDQFIKTSRAVDMATGDLYGLASVSTPDYVKVGSSPGLAGKGFPDPNTFYEVGFDWQATSVRFFIVQGGAEVTLWNLTDARFVPQAPLQLMYNVWHPATHWLPARTAANYPSEDAEMRVDWLAFDQPIRSP